MTARIEPEWLLDLFPERVKEISTVVWNRTHERVEQVNVLLCDKLVIEESRGPASDEAAADLFARRALEVGIEQFVEKELLDKHLARLAFASFEAPDIPRTLREVSLGLHSFNELKEAAKSSLLCSNNRWIRDC